jgi:carboxypeptidase T
VLGVHFIDFSGRLLQDNTIRLDWDAVADNQHDHFDVEKSTDQQSFVSIGSVNGAAPYYFIDRSPAVGNNYYRIKAIDRNGQSQYSKVINIVYKRRLALRINTERPENVSVQIADMLGQVMYKGKHMVNSTSSAIPVETRAWKPGLYVVKVVNSDNETLAIEKFIKQ